MSTSKELLQHLQFDSLNRVAIIGAARSGIAAAHYFMKHGVQPFISDTCTNDALAALLQKNGLGEIPYEVEGHTEKITETDVIILSPGVRSDLPILKIARERGVPIWSEMELGFRASDATFLAVTGSTGKSTTVSLLGEALKAGGKQAVVAGNIGIPVIAVAPELPAEAYVVAEVSSFQLETIDTFRPRVAAILNLMKNHLDRYTSEYEYYEAKKQIARNLTSDDFLILNNQDPLLRRWSVEMQASTNVVFFGQMEDTVDCFWYDNGFIKYRFNGESGILLDVKNMHLKGRHNYENACVAAFMAKIVGVDEKAIVEGICDFKGLPHRLEFIAEIGGVAYYNDSKSTTAESMVCAIDSFEKNVILIAGGKDKGCDFSIVDDAICGRVKKVVLIGEASDRMSFQWKGLTALYQANSLDDAVEHSANSAQSGDVVVFSPGCSSFDMFKNYEERGEMFKKLVAHVAEGVVR